MMEFWRAFKLGDTDHRGIKHTLLHEKDCDAQSLPHNDGRTPS